jgi:hypothetical protein
MLRDSLKLIIYKFLLNTVNLVNLNNTLNDFQFF